VTGAVILTPTSLFKEIGGLNEKLNWSWDDSFYCMEAQERNKKVVYCGGTKILHSESASLKKNPVNKLFFKQNLQIFIDRWKHRIDKELVAKYDKDSNFRLYK
jgi:GT2 family glycosyltransferase